MPAGVYRNKDVRISHGANRTAAIRWAVLTVALAAAVGLSAYWSALASRPVTQEASPAPQPAPGLVQLGNQPRPKLSPAARDRAFARGRREGLREGRRAARRDLVRRLGGFVRWDPDAAYVVTASPDGKGIAARVGPVHAGESYALCRDHRRVCVRRPD